MTRTLDGLQAATPLLIVTPLLGALVGAGLGLGLLLCAAGATRRPPAPVRAKVPLRERWATLTRRPAGVRGTRRDLKLAVVVGVAFVVFALSGWVLALLVVPVVGLLVPWLLADQNKAGIARTAALEGWIRNLRGLLQGGADNTLEAALRGSLSAAPEPIRAEVGNLVVRLNARWPTEQALAAFADELHDSTADMIVAALMLTARRRGYGISEILANLAESVGDEVRARRRIESDRGLARTAARGMTLLFALLAAAFFVFNRSFLAPYATGPGEVILAAIIALFVAILALLRRLTTAQDNPRIYPRPHARAGGGPYVG